MSRSSPPSILEHPASAQGEVRETAEEIRSLLDDALDQTRSLTMDLSPPALYELGLKSALDYLAQEMEQLLQPLWIDRRDRIQAFLEQRHGPISVSQEADHCSFRADVVRVAQMVPTAFGMPDVGLLIERHKNGGQEEIRRWSA